MGKGNISWIWGLSLVLGVLICSASLVVSGAGFRRQPEPFDDAGVSPYRVFPDVGIDAPPKYEYCEANRLEEDVMAHVRNISAGGYKLVQLQNLFRHGDRTPLGAIRITPNYTDHNTWDCSVNELNDYDRDTDAGEGLLDRMYRKLYETNREPLRGNCGLGELSARGADMQTRVGELIRKVYIDELGALPSDLDPSDMFVRAGDEERLLHSAQAQLRGIYPPASTHGKPTPIIDMFVRDAKWDNMTPNPKACPALQALKDQSHASSQWKQHEADGDQVDQLMEESFGKGNMDKFIIVDLARGQYCHDLQDFYCLSKENLQKVIDWQTWDFCFFPNDTASFRLGIGSFIGDMWSELMAKVKKTPDSHSLVLWSGHDSTLIPVLRALRVFDGYWPPYASHLFWELWTRDGKYYISMVYNGVELQVPGCNQSPCPIEDFYNSIKDILPVDIYVECLLGQKDRSIVVNRY